MRRRCSRRRRSVAEIAPAQTSVGHPLDCGASGAKLTPKPTASITGLSSQNWRPQPADFDSAIRRFDPSRPSHMRLVLLILRNFFV
jgi:hypothetical protein